ncbi:hypothetical protein NL676_001381 [Syzygium grande]|nr:hypothetical protein NL676_001381 [Syzygium grande]
MASSSSSSLDRLPQDIVADILLRLPAKTLLDLCCVCKSWSSLVLAPSFAAKHLGLHRLLRSKPHQNLQLLHLPCAQHDWPVPAHNADFCSVLCSDPVSGSYTLRAKLAIPFDEHALSFEVIGSVDGLVCVSMLHKRSKLWTIQSMYLWNPAMRKLRDLGNRAELDAGMSRYQIHGFGRDRGGHIYRVVRITYGCTRKGGEGEFDGGRPSRDLHGDDSRACINGVVHWPASVTEDSPYSFILSFEVASQMFDKLPMPENYLDNFKLHKETQVSIAALKESLATLVCCPGAGNIGSEIHVWVMKRYGVADSWTKQYTAVMQQRIERVLGLTRNGEILIHRSDHKVMCYDSENDMRFKDIGVTGFPRSV